MTKCTTWIPVYTCKTRSPTSTEFAGNACTRNKLNYKFHFFARNTRLVAVHSQAVATDEHAAFSVVVPGSRLLFATSGKCFGIVVVVDSDSIRLTPLMVWGGVEFGVRFQQKWAGNDRYRTRQHRSQSAGEGEWRWGHSQVGMRM